jgi:hypothetical protein
MIGEILSEYYTGVITGIASVFIIITASHFYKKDEARRRNRGMISNRTRLSHKVTSLKWTEIILLLLMGAAYSFYGSGIVSYIVGVLLKQEVTGGTAQLGGNLAFMILWVGILAPIAEEMIFRWLIYLRLRDHRTMMTAAVISGAIFGIYHMNLTQAIYAGVMGVLCAYIMEMSRNLWSCIFIHAGGNLFSLILSEDNVQQVLLENEAWCLILVLALLIFFAEGFLYFRKKGSKQ